MLILGGYLLTFDQLYQLGLRHGLVIEGGRASILNRNFHEKGITAIYAWPISHPWGTCTTKGAPHILICSHKPDDNLIRLADCQPFKLNEDDLKVKKWLCYEHGLSAANSVLNHGPTRTHRSHGRMWSNPDQEDVPRPGVMAHHKDGITPSLPS